MAVDGQLREGEQQRTSKLSAIWLAPFGELITARAKIIAGRTSEQYRLPLAKFVHMCG